MKFAGLPPAGSAANVPLFHQSDNDNRFRSCNFPSFPFFFESACNFSPVSLPLYLAALVSSETTR